MKKEELQELLGKSKTKLDNLEAIQYEGLRDKITELQSVFKEFNDGGNELISQDSVLQIGIVGQVKAGKSSFLNSLFFEGEDILPRASTPMTAGLTVIEYNDNNTFEIEYFNEADWDIFVKQNVEYENREKEVKDANVGAPESVIRQEMERRTSAQVRSAHEMVSMCTSKAKNKIGKKNDVQPFTDIDELQNVLEQYVGANGEYTSVVKSLFIKIKDERLEGLRIVDTPGVNDPVVSRENRTRTFLHACHGVFLLSGSSDFLGSGDISFLNSRIGGSGIGTVVLLASKFDSVLQDIGAQRIMSNEEPGDLVDTIEMQKKKFKRRLREQSESIDEKLRGKIELDTTAGIGYSIAHKAPSKWDDIENQVVKQMSRFYPNYFSNEKDIKETFEGLANIEDIREKYLNGVFLKNKDSIIEERVKAFFVTNKDEINKTIERILTEYKDRRVQLNETTFAEIQKQKDIQGKLFESLKATFSDIFRKFNIELNAEVKHIANNVRFEEIYSIPTEETTGSITYKGEWWGHNTDNMSYTQVNTFELNQQVLSAIEKYCDDWNKEWQELFTKAKNDMSEKLGNSISTFERDIMSTSFDDTYYRHLIDKALDELKSNEELGGIGDMITKYRREGSDIAKKQFVPSPDDTREVKAGQVKSILRRELDDHNHQLIQSLRSIADGIVTDVKTKANQNLKSATEEVDNLKGSFAEKLKEEGKQYLEALERDMKEKTEALKKIDSIITELTDLSSIYKK